jgi:hypothetical protein
MENLQHLAPENGIELTRLVGMQANRAKACAKLATNIQASRLTLKQQKYQLKEIQELDISCNLDIWVIERKKIEGWARKPKGLFQVLWETRLINPELPRSKDNNAERKDKTLMRMASLNPELCTQFKAEKKDKTLMRMAS